MKGPVVLYPCMSLCLCILLYSTCALATYCDFDKIILDRVRAINTPIAKNSDEKPYIITKENLSFNKLAKLIVITIAPIDIRFKTPLTLPTNLSLVIFKINVLIPI